MASAGSAKTRRSKAAGDVHETLHAVVDGAASVMATSGNGDVAWLVIHGAAQNNLKRIEARIPLGRFTCVTGVSGSGKSSLVNDILYAALARELNRAETAPGGFARIEVEAIPDSAARNPGEKRSALAEPVPRKAGWIAPSLQRHLDKIIAIDQTPIGRTPRSNPATYIKLFDEIRSLFTKLPDAKLRGYKPGRFSFNVPSHRGGGRCEVCEGNGANRIEMDFLADVWVTCPVCEGRRFTRETRQIQYKGRSIAEVLEMDVQQALEHFENVPRIREMLQTLHDVGLDYIKIGQPSPTLSGGEAQRIKLARELVKKATGRTIYILDEPTTGLHFEDIRRLLAVLHGFVDAGNTVVVIEHNLDVIKTADWIIDLGPEGGDAGGQIIAEGTPEEIAENEGSYTGAALRETLQARLEPRFASTQSAVRSESTSSFVVHRSKPHADSIVVRGARQHNLKDVSVAFPRNRMTVCSGVSGSGKTSFAIDTVFTEGYRRYVESLSAYARQFLGQMQKPKVEHVEGLSPAICIEQKAASKSPRSTVGTITEIYDYMRVLWARVGTPFCPRCRVPIGSQTADEIVDRVFALEEATPIIVLAPIRPGDAETWTSVFNRLKASGYMRVRVDGRIEQTTHALTLDQRRKHRVEVVVDRTIVRRKSRGRITESIEHALAMGNGVMVLLVEEMELHEERREDAETPENDEKREEGAEGGRDSSPTVTVRPAREMMFSQRLACMQCGNSYEDLGPHQFSFNSPLGWCETCEGLGVQRGAPAASIVRNPNRSLLNGAIGGWRSIDSRSPLGKMLAALCRRLGVDVHAPLRDWTPDQRKALMFGTEGEWIDGGEAFDGVRFHWRGFFPTIDAATRASWTLRFKLHNVVSDIPCSVCRGGRLRADASAVRLGAGELAFENREAKTLEGETPVAGPARRTAKTGEPVVRMPPAASIAGATIVQVCEMPLSEVKRFFDELKLDARQKKIAGELLKEIRDRLQFLLDVGLEYLHLHRAAPTLSGGEAQRIRLASQIGSGLSGVLYVLDEPTIGLHPRDNARLVRALDKLRRLGNTLLVVEHDRDVIRAADRVLDFGPRAGAAGGRVVAEGLPGEWVAQRWGGAKNHREVEGQEDSLTRAYLSGEAAIPIPTNRRPVDADAARRLMSGMLDHAPTSHSTAKAGIANDSRQALLFEIESDAPPAGEGDVRVVYNDECAAKRPLRSGRTASKCIAGGPDSKRRKPQSSSWLVIRGARQNNLKNLTIPIPLGKFTCITGVSGSGKSSLINDILWPALAAKLQRANLTPGEHDAIEGIEQIDQVINVDQSPIGSTPSSNPATYTGAFDDIRELFARLPDSKVRGYNANRFSFNRPGGRCEACEGYGRKRIEMHFLPDVWVECDVCRGRRYNPETLDVKFKGRTISDVLEMRIAEAMELFESVPRVRRKLQTLAEVGLDYVQLGQPAPTLSGGEAQRVKLSSELARQDTGKTLYILDEPTTGLHFDDVRKLLGVIQRLADLGNTLIVVEHNLDVLKCSDWIIDLGPEAGEAGGYIVAMGTPEGVVANGAGGAAVEDSPASRFAIGDPKHEARSYTAEALRPILAAGPFEERTRFDAKAHAAAAIDAGRSGFGDVGRETKMPWQIDGRKWHLKQRTSRAGKPTRWETAALEYVIDLIEAVGMELAGPKKRKNDREMKSGRGKGAALQRGAGTSVFSPTNWNERASIEITAPGASVWFFHALTGGEWLLELYFRVPPKAFAAKRLDRQLGLKTLNEREDIQEYGDWPRVDIRSRMDGFDAVVVYVHDVAEISTPAFRMFVMQAAKAYLAGIRSLT